MITVSNLMGFCEHQEGRYRALLCCFRSLTPRFGNRLGLLVGRLFDCSEKLLPDFTARDKNPGSSAALFAPDGCKRPAVDRGPSFGLVFDVYELREVQGLYWALTYGVQSDFVVTALAGCLACCSILFGQQKGRLH